MGECCVKIRGTVARVHGGFRIPFSPLQEWTTNILMRKRRLDSAQRSIPEAAFSHKILPVRPTAEIPSRHMRVQA
ncbi:hypothetical protein EVAR_78948_1 [Eumeta japonica]|uniref:Uncharacterized protein n=1 Tax=Eumeta variegata TaxID=151549 RepID=A0A4C1U2R3_EUMVA|nr:hypothetical protein EVAR_78948_1 [Eumeta japonica]